MIEELSASEVWPEGRFRPTPQARGGRAGSLALLILAGSFLAQAMAIAQATPLDDRIALMTRELDLSGDQQAQVKKALLEQRQQLVALWDDAAVPAALRISRTQALADRTAEHIRAMLSEEQRKKYSQPHKRSAQVGTAGADIGAWGSPAKSP